MNKQIILPTAIAAVIGLAGLSLVLYAWHMPPFKPAMPSTENAYLRGTITPVSPQVSGYIREVPVVDFQEVKEGDVIAVIDDRSARQKLAQAEASLAAALAAIEVANQNVQSAEVMERAYAANLESAEIQLATAHNDTDRTSALRERGVATEAAGEQALLMLQKAEAAVRYAQAQLDAQHQQVQTARAQIASGEAQKASAEAALEIARLDVENTVVRAPTDGRLGQVAARVGQFVSAGTALVSHVGQDVWLVANFNESDMTDIHLGDAVSFTVDAVKGLAFTGHVESFSPATASEFSLTAGTNATGNFTKIAQRVPVRIAIDAGQEGIDRLAPGYSAIVALDE